MHTSIEYYRAFPVDEQWFKEYSKQKLTMPVLAIGGEYVGNTFPYESFQQLAENVRGNVIAGCGHFIAEEKPEELTQQVLAFFEEDS